MTYNAKFKGQTQIGLNFHLKITSINGSKTSPKGSKWLAKSILEASWEAKLKRIGFGRPRGRLKYLLWEAIWEPKIIPEPLWKRFQHSTDTEERFGMLLRRLGYLFLSVCVCLRLRELR